MNRSLVFIRSFFALISIFFLTIFMTSVPTGQTSQNILIGIGLGLLFSLLLYTFETLFRRFNLRSFNIAIIGIFIGYLMGQSLVFIFNEILAFTQINIAFQTHSIELIKILLLLFGIYVGWILTARASDELYISIPFVKFTPLMNKKKDLLIDVSILSDARIIDFAATGLLDHQLIIPRFLIKDLHLHSENSDEISKAKTNRALETLKKLEALASLDLRYEDTDFPEIKDTFTKLTRIARLLDAHLLTADMSRLQSATVEGIRVINLHTLANALKPLMQMGELLKIKIHRYGKEPRQGVGYLEDGTMVVVNGGADYIGEIIDSHVLSVKHTSSGRIIFCNALDENKSFSHEFDDSHE